MLLLLQPPAVQTRVEVAYQERAVRGARARAPTALPAGLWGGGAGGSCIQCIRAQGSNIHHTRGCVHNVCASRLPTPALRVPAHTTHTRRSARRARSTRRNNGRPDVAALKLSCVCVCVWLLQVAKCFQRILGLVDWPRLVFNIPTHFWRAGSHGPQRTLATPHPEKRGRVGRVGSKNDPSQTQETAPQIP